MTLAEWVAALDVRLKDSGSVLFTVPEKEAHVEAAVQEYSRRVPRVFTAEVAVVAGVQSYALPEGCPRVLRVFLPVPATEDVGAEVTGGVAGRVRGWEVISGALWLFPVPQESFVLRVECAGAWSYGTVPAADTELVLVAAHARCCEVLATDTARAFAFWSGSEKFDKGQVSEHYRDLAVALRRQFARLSSRG